jgi:hypothetical protein
VNGDSFGLPETIGRLPEHLINFDVAGPRLLAIGEQKVEAVPVMLVTNWMHGLVSSP